MFAVDELVPESILGKGKEILVGETGSEPSGHGVMSARKFQPAGCFSLYRELTDGQEVIVGSTQAAANGAGARWRRARSVSGAFFA